MTFEIVLYLLAEEIKECFDKGYTYSEMKLFEQEEGICDYIQDNLDLFNEHSLIQRYHPFKLTRGGGPIVFYIPKSDDLH